MSTGVLIAVIAGGVILLMAIGGYLVTRRRTPDWSEHVAEADALLEAARATDKGWDRELLDAAARGALERERPGWAYRDLHLVLVDDKPGMDEDKAHFVATGEDAEARVVLARNDAGEWRVASVS